VTEGRVQGVEESRGRAKSGYSILDAGSSINGCFAIIENPGSSINHHPDLNPEP